MLTAWSRSRRFEASGIASRTSRRRTRSSSGDSSCRRCRTHRRCASVVLRHDLDELASCSPASRYSQSRTSALCRPRYLCSTARSHLAVLDSEARRVSTARRRQLTRRELRCAVSRSRSRRSTSSAASPRSSTRPTPSAPSAAKSSPTSTPRRVDLPSTCSVTAATTDVHGRRTRLARRGRRSQVRQDAADNDRCTHTPANRE